MQVAVLASKGVISQRDLNRAYQYFNIDPGHAHVISDEHIIGCFRARLSDISPLQADEARKQLRVLGDARESDKIRAEASDSVETYEQAMAWFELDSNASDDFVQTMYSLKVLCALSSWCLPGPSGQAVCHTQQLLTITSDPRQPHVPGDRPESTVYHCGDAEQRATTKLPEVRHSD
jgi:hypothetical protein